MPNDNITNLDAAHAAMCVWCRRVLESEEPSLADLKLVREFLKDNHISAIPTAASPLGDLADTAVAAGEADPAQFDTSEPWKVIGPKEAKSNAALLGDIAAGGA